MKLLAFSMFVLCVLSCQNVAEINSEEKQNEHSVQKADFTLVFASCNDQDREQPLWTPIIESNPDLFIWGGDNIYADTEDMSKMEADYQKVWAEPEYKSLAKNTIITGTWDDHDFGKNDAGVEWEWKKEAQD